MSSAPTAASLASPHPTRRELRALVVDDEMVTRVHLRSLLAEVGSVKICGEAASVAEGTKAAENLRPDLIFLDIELGEESGFELLGNLSFAPAVICISHSPRYAVRAFDVAAVDYIHKPLTQSRLRQAIDRVVDPHARGQETLTDVAVLGMEERVVLVEGHRRYFVQVSEITAVVSDAKYSRIERVGGRSILSRQALQEWERRLPPEHFRRIDRSAILNVERIDYLEKRPSRIGYVYFKEVDQPLELGRTAVERLEEMEQSGVIL